MNRRRLMPALLTAAMTLAGMVAPNGISAVQGANSQSKMATSSGPQQVTPRPGARAQHISHFNIAGFDVVSQRTHPIWRGRAKASRGGKARWNYNR